MEKERALLIGTSTGQKGEWEVLDSLEELSRLAETAGACVEKTIVQELKKIDASLLIGKGKTQEVRAYVESNPIDLVIFDHELTPTHQRNLETLFNTKTILSHQINRINIHFDILFCPGKSIDYLPYKCLEILRVSGFYQNMDTVPPFFT